jgi:hypothetical protein
MSSPRRTTLYSSRKSRYCPLLRQSTVLLQGFDYCCLLFIVNKLTVQTQLSAMLASLHHPQIALPTLARPRGRVFKSLHGVNIYDTTRGSLNKSWGHNNALRVAWGWGWNDLDSTDELIHTCILTVRELRSSGWYAGWWAKSCSATEKEIYTVVKNFMLLSILKKWLTSQ